MARICPTPGSRNSDRLRNPLIWHPFGMRVRGEEGTGGVATLNHRKPKCGNGARRTLCKFMRKKLIK